MSIDLIASRPHWMDHLAPVAAELDRRGELGTIWLGKPDHAIRKLTVVAAASDLRLAKEARRRPILMQHGIGQSYSGRNRSYPGGMGHEICPVVLMPNEVSASRHRRFYRARPPAVVVGSPRLDDLAELAPPWPTMIGPPVIAVTWHWDCKAMGPEGGTAWTTIGPAVLERLVQMRDVGVIRLLGHAHPKGHDMVRDAYDEAEVPFVEDFRDVVLQADLLVFDNTSVGFEFAALDRPVVVIDSPKWRSSVRYPPRFWSHADVGPRTADPDAVPAKIFESLADEAEIAARRRKISADLFPHRGQAAERAVDAILDVA
jgi:hypothetical protein